MSNVGNCSKFVMSCRDGIIYIKELTTGQPTKPHSDSLIMFRAKSLIGVKVVDNVGGYDRYDYRDVHLLIDGHTISLCELTGLGNIGDRSIDSISVFVYKILLDIANKGDVYSLPVYNDPIIQE